MVYKCFEGYLLGKWNQGLLCIYSFNSNLAKSRPISLFAPLVAKSSQKSQIFGTPKLPGNFDGSHRRHACPTIFCEAKL